jgi:hypothetical protein
MDRNCSNSLFGDIGDGILSPKNNRHKSDWTPSRCVEQGAQMYADILGSVALNHLAFTDEQPDSLMASHFQR